MSCMYICVLGVGGVCAPCVGSVTGEATPEHRGAHNACLYLVYSRETGWRWGVYMHNSNRSNCEAPGGAMMTLN